MCRSAPAVHGCRSRGTGSTSEPAACPTDVVSLIALWRLRYKLSLRDLADARPASPNGNLLHRNNNTMKLS
jgi:hypothetical protein